MTARCVPILLLLASACAAGEPIGEPAEPLELGADDPPLRAEIYVDVADDAGRPIAADEVWIAVGPDTASARCMADDCGTWVAQVEPEDHATAYAEVCGFVFLEPIEMAAVDAMHVTITADDEVCGPERTHPASPRL